MAGSGKSGLGWVILAAALAVPGFLFYNWWSHLKAEREKAVSQKARGRVPDGGVFQQSSPDGKLVNPIASSTMTAAPAAATPMAAAPAPEPMPVSAPAPAPVAPEPPPLAAAQPPPVSAPPPEAAPVPAAEPAPTAVVLSSAPVLALKRDPMISPFDIVRMQQAELERQLERERLMNAARPVKQRRAVEPPIEGTIELQGIVSNPDGENKAIINGEVVGVGETFGRARPVRVVKITSVGVTFLYKGRRFVKGINNE